MILTYKSSNGKEFSLLTWEGLKLEKADFHAYKWKKDTTKKTLGEIVNRFTKDSQLYKCTILFKGTPEERQRRIDEFHFCTEYDIAHMTPGRITWGVDYIDGYILESDTKPRNNGVNYAENTISIYCPYPMWIEEQIVNINPARGDEEEGAATDKAYNPGYPYDYSYAPAPTATHAVIDHYADSDFKLIAYGPFDKLSVTIAGHVYEVNYPIRANQYMVIDSRQSAPADRQCYVVSESGIITNVFNYRHDTESIFKKIPSGDVLINYSRAYGITLTVFKERSEPRARVYSF